MFLHKGEQIFNKDNSIYEQTVIDIPNIYRWEANRYMELQKINNMTCIGEYNEVSTTSAMTYCGIDGEKGLFKTLKKVIDNTKVKRENLLKNNPNKISESKLLFNKQGNINKIYVDELRMIERLLGMNNKSLYGEISYLSLSSDIKYTSKNGETGLLKYIVNSFDDSLTVEYQGKSITKSI